MAWHTEARARAAAKCKAVLCWAVFASGPGSALKVFDLQAYRSPRALEAGVVSRRAVRTREGLGSDTCEVNAKRGKEGYSALSSAHSPA